jgi:hypothetical protein
VYGGRRARTLPVASEQSPSAIATQLAFSCWLDADLLLFIDHLFHAIQHSMQVGCGIFNVKIFILSRPTFDGKYSTTVNILEIAIGKLVSSFRGYHDA